MLTVNSEVKKIYGKTEGAIHSKTGVSPIEFNANNQGLISWSMLGNGEQASSQTYSITEQPPISFNADGNPLASWSMVGNGQQSGTPTPNAPIMPEFCGVRTANLFNASAVVTDFIIDDENGNERYTTNSVCSDYIEIEPQKSYFITPMTSGNWGAWYDENKVFISGISGYGVKASPAGAKYARLTVNYAGRNPDYATSFMVVQGATGPATFIPYGFKIPITCAGQTVPVYLGQTQTVRKIKKLALTGTERWVISTGWKKTTTSVFYMTLADITHASADNAVFVYSNAFAAASRNGLYNGDSNMVARTGSDSLTIRISDSIATTTDDFKSYLAQQYSAGTPVTIWYVLATPETAIVNEPLCKIGDYADELHGEDATVTIPTQNGSNTLTIGSTLQPSSMTITTASSVYPKNPIMPEFCGERTGNLFDYKTAYSGYINADGDVSGVASSILAIRNSLADFVGKTLTISVYCKTVNSTRIYLQGNINGSDSGHASSGIAQGQSGTISLTVTPETANDYWYISYGSGGSSVNSVNSLMLNTGSTALPYEPYGYKIPVTNAGTTTNIYALEPLRKIGDYADVVGSNGAVTRRIKKLVLTGTENTWSATYWVHAFVLYGAPSETRPQGISNYAICPHFVQASTTNLSAGQFNVDYNESSGIMRFGFNYTGFADITEFKAWLATQYANGNPVTVWYVLATPTTEQITAPTIPTQNGANTVSVDTPVPPSSLTIQYTSPDISEIVRAVDGQGKPLYGPRYGFKIDKSQTDSASAIIYTHDAVTMTPAYMDYANGSFNYGSWGNAWFVKEAKPVALNLDGTIAYYLDPDDYTKKLDGTNSDIFYTLLSVEPSDWSTQWKQYYHLNNGEYVLNDDAEAPTFAANTYYKLDTSFTGNFMVQFPKVYFKRYEDENYNYVEVSDRKLSRDFKAYAHLNANGDEVDFIYLPMFKGVIQSSKLRSIPGVIPQGGTTASEEVTAAEACGTGWQIWDHSSREMINDLLVLMSKNADSQAKFGKGRESGYDASDTATYGKLQTGTLIKKGAFYGYNTSYSDIKVFHIEGPWANRWERLQGLLLVDGVYKIKMAPPYNFTGTDFVTLTTASPTSNNYVRTLATSEYGSVPATVSAFASSPFKDYFYQSQSGTRVGVVGGYCNGGSACGRRCVALIYTALSSNWVIGASAIYK